MLTIIARHLRFVRHVVRKGNKLEMDRSSPNAELRPKNSAERSAQFGSATCELFGRTSAKIWRHFCGSVLAAFCVNLKSLNFVVAVVYLILVTS